MTFPSDFLFESSLLLVPFCARCVCASYLKQSQAEQSLRANALAESIESVPPN